MERCIARDGGGRGSEDGECYKGSFMELLIEEDDDRELVSEKTEEAGFVFFPTNRFLSVSSSSSTVQMLCFGREDGYDNGGVLSIDQNCKPIIRRKAIPVVGIRNGGRCGRLSSSISARGKRKKAKLQASPVSRALQMGREKLGSHVRALQQLVSPMGKSDAASVLQEAIGYIRFLHDQVQVLSSAYVEAETEPAMEPDSGGGEGHLRKRGLCLVPVSSTVIMAGSNGADMWAPAISIDMGRNAAISPAGSKP